LKSLQNQLLVSCQPSVGGPMDSPAIIAAMAHAAIIGGASGVRIEGIENVKAVRRLIDKPIIGLVKLDLENSPVRITPLVQNVVDLAAAGADIIALDVTERARPQTLESLFLAIKKAGVLSMADCSCLADARRAVELDADILSSTMSGYTTADTPTEPDIELVRQLTGLGKFVIAEGRYNSPDLVASAIAAGADSVVVGSAITRIEVVTGWFRAAVKSMGGR